MFHVEQTSPLIPAPSQPRPSPAWVVRVLGLRLAEATGFGYGVGMTHQPPSDSNGHPARVPPVRPRVTYRGRPDPSVVEVSPIPDPREAPTRDLSESSIGGSKTGRRPALPLDEDGQVQPVDPVRARRAVAYVNISRIQLAERLANITLFPDPSVAASPVANTRPGDHPIIQTLFAIRDKIRHLELDDFPEKNGESKRQTLILQGLAKMGDLSLKVLDEVNRAGKELQAVLDSEANLEQRKKEHRDRMRVAGDKLADIPEDELIAMLAAKDASVITGEVGDADTDDEDPDEEEPDAEEGEDFYERPASSQL